MGWGGRLFAHEEVEVEGEGEDRQEEEGEDKLKHLPAREKGVPRTFARCGAGWGTENVNMVPLSFYTCLERSLSIIIIIIYKRERIKEHSESDVPWPHG